MANPGSFPALALRAPSRLSPSKSSRQLDNTLAGHLLGMVAGYFAVFLFHAAIMPSVISTEILTVPRFAASVLAVFLTVFGQLRLKAFHPPAAATTLLIALGSFRFGLKEIEVLIVGIFLIAAFGELFRRLRL